MQLQIQVWDVSQAETIIRFNRKCFLTDLWKPEDWRELLADPRAIYYGAVDMDTGALAGNLFIYNWQGEQDYIKIMNLGVHPDYRGQGLAHRLLTHAAREMTALGMKRFAGRPGLPIRPCGRSLKHAATGWSGRKQGIMPIRKKAPANMCCALSNAGRSKAARHPRGGT